MIRLTDSIWIGNSADEAHADLTADGIKGVLNVAQDMVGTRRWSDGVEYMQVGLIDGPGNTLITYSASVLALAALQERRGKVLVCCHSGKSRSLAVVVMYLILKNGRVTTLSSPHRWQPWHVVLHELCHHTGVNLGDPHAAHKEAADMLPYGLLEHIV